MRPSPYINISFFFFFQAEDGIRDHCVTGVQTCALPISNTNLAKELVIHAGDRANAEADRNIKTQQLGLQTMKTHADIGIKQTAHGLNLRSHALDAASAAHDAAMDVAGGINKPNEAAA